MFASSVPVNRTRNTTITVLYNYRKDAAENLEDILRRFKPDDALQQTIEIKPSRRQRELSRSLDRFVAFLKDNVLSGRLLNGDPDKRYLSRFWKGPRLVEVHWQTDLVYLVLQSNVSSR